MVQTCPGMCASYSVPVSHPVPSRYLASARQLPSEASIPRCHTATPFGSIRLGLRLAKYLEIRYIWLIFKNMCRARHTPDNAADSLQSRLICSLYRGKTMRLKLRFQLPVNFLSLLLLIAVVFTITLPGTDCDALECPLATSHEFDDENKLAFLKFKRSKFLFRHGKTDFFVGELLLESGQAYQQIVAVHNARTNESILDIQFIYGDDGQRGGLVYKSGLIYLYANRIHPCLEKLAAKVSSGWISHYTYDTSFYTEKERSGKQVLPPLIATIFTNRPQFPTDRNQRIPWKPKYLVDGLHLSFYVKKGWALTVNDAKKARQDILTRETEKKRQSKLTPEERIAEISGLEDEKRKETTSKGFIFRDRFYWQNYTYAREIKGILDGTLDIRTSLFPHFLVGYVDRFYKVCGSNFPSSPIFQKYREYRNMKTTPYMSKAISRDMLYLYGNEGCRSPFMEQFRENMARLVSGERVLQEETDMKISYAQRDANGPKYPQELKRACREYQEYRKITSGPGVAATGLWCQCIQDKFEDILSPEEYRRAVEDYARFSRRISAVPKDDWTYYNAHTTCVKCKDDQYYDCMKISDRMPGMGTYRALAGNLEGGRFEAIENDLFFRMFYRSFVETYAQRCPDKIVQKVIIDPSDNSFIEKKYFDFYMKSKRLDELGMTAEILKSGQGRFTLDVTRRLLESVAFMESYIAGNCNSKRVRTAYENLYRKAYGLEPIRP